MPRCLVVQHVPPEGPYAIGDELVAAGVELVTHRIFNGDPIPPDTAGWDGLVVMGGPMSAAEDIGFPTRRAEIALLRAALAAGTPTLGVCLGAQLLAVAAGSSVYPGPFGPEIGWGTVDLTQQAGSDDLLGGLPSPVTVLHWHGDTFDLPVGAVRLAGNAIYENQAFRLGTTAWGLQFHAEVDGAAVESFVESFASEAIDAGTDPHRILDQMADGLAAMAETRALVAGRFSRLVAAEGEVTALAPARASVAENSEPDRQRPTQTAREVSP